MAELDAILARLDRGGWEGLAAALVDHLLASPLADLLEPALMADLVVTTLEATVENPTTESWLRARVQEARAAVPQGKLRARVPPEIVRPLGELLARPYSPDRTLVRRLLRHDAVERLFKDTLVGAITSFARKLRTPAVGAASLRGLGRLKDSFGEGMRESLLGGLSHELERHAEARIRDFVDGALGTIMDEVAVHLTSPDNATRQGEWRAYVLDTLLDTDLRTLAGELDKLDQDAIVHTTRAVLQAIVRRPGLSAEIRGGIERIAQELGARTLAETLAEAGLEEASWRPGLEALLTRQVRGFGTSPQFRAWFEATLQG